MSDWTRAFESLFAALRAELCPYFYYVSEEFHVLFRAGAGDQPLCALLSSSTKGLRRKLRDHAIDFTTPYGAEVEQSEEQLRCQFSSDADPELLAGARPHFSPFPFFSAPVSPCISG